MAVAISSFHNRVERMVRVLLVAAMLTVGALQASRCTESDNDYGDHASTADRAERTLR